MFSGFDVTMDDPVGMSARQGRGNTAGDGERIVQRQLVLAFEASPERFALDVGHDVPRRGSQWSTVHRAGVEEREDVRMLEGGGEADLAHEQVGQGDQLAANDLEGDWAAVPQVAGEVDGGHAAPAELALDAVAAVEIALKVEGEVGHVTPWNEC